MLRNGSFSQNGHGVGLMRIEAQACRNWLALMSNVFNALKTSSRSRRDALISMLSSYSPRSLWSFGHRGQSPFSPNVMRSYLG